MKKVLILCLLFSWWSSRSQEVLVSDKISIRDDYAFFLLGKLNDQYLLLRDKETKFIVQAFNSRLDKTWNKELDLDGRRTEIIESFGVTNSFYVLYQYRRKAHTLLKIHRYDPTALLTDSLVIKDFGVRFSTPYPLVQFSSDRSKIFIYYLEDKLVHTMGFDVVSMKKLWEETVELDGSFRDRYLFQPIITDKGDGYIAYEVNNRKSTQHKHQFIVHHLSSRGTEKASVKVPDFLTMDYHFVYDPLHDKLIGTGLYSLRNISRANGVFVFFLDFGDLQNTIPIKTIGFSPRLLSTLSGKTGKRNAKGAEDLQISNVVVRSDGGVVMLMEKIKTFHRSPIDLPGQYRRSALHKMATEYYFEDVFSLSIAPSGRPEWKAFLYKEQTSQNDQGIFSSYFLWENKSTLRLIFNDEINYSANVIEYRLSTSGESKRYTIFNTGEDPLLIRMRDGLQIAANEAIFPSQYRKKLNLVLIRY